MWKPTAIVLLACSTLCAAPPSSKPASQPAKQKFSLMNGAVRYLVPGGWKERDRSDDGRKAQYQSPDEKATMYVTVLPQEYPIPQHNLAFKEKMKTAILGAMKKKFEDQKTQMIYGPKAETDDRFLLRIADREKGEEGTLDEVHLYRAAGLDLLSVTTTVLAETPAEAKPFHTMGEDTCLSIVLGPADKKK